MKIDLMTKTELKREIMFLKVDVEAKQKYINNMDRYIKELKEEIKNLKTNKKIVC